MIGSCNRLTVAGLSTYRLFGVVGYALGLSVAMLGAVELGLDASARLIVVAVPPATLLATFALARRGWWRGPIVFHEKAVLAVAMTALGLVWLGAPVGAGVDVTVLGIGAFLAVGRLGCLNAGCCHGRRARRGLRYRWEHAAHGFPLRWVGLTLFPIQLVDAAVSATAVAVGYVALRLAAPGDAAAVFTCIYGLGRFVIDRYRGDGARNQKAGLTEAQWAMVGAVVFAAFARPAWWSISSAIAIAIAALAIVTASRLRRWPLLWLTSGWHLAEIDARLGELIADADAATTSGGLNMRLTSAANGELELELRLRDRALSQTRSRAIAGQLGRTWTVTSVAGSTIRLVSGVRAEALSD